MIKKIITFLFCTSVAISTFSEEKKIFSPEIHGTIRAKYEYEPDIDKGRFEVRNARLAIEGKIVPVINYKAEIDLSDEGNIKMLDAYIRYQPDKSWKFTFGQMRVPFTIDAHRSPHLQFFANRSFIAKQVGNVRDVGVAASWTLNREVPITFEGGIFNGSGLTNQKNFWTDNYNFSFKVQTMINKHSNITLSCQKANAGDANTYMYDVGTFYNNDRWHIEAEYLRKYYSHNLFKPVNAIDAFIVYKLHFDRYFDSISFLGRYDYMSDHSKGSEKTEGRLTLDDAERHRITGGVTFSIGKKSYQADIRINYEQYFYSNNVIPSISEQSKAVVEFVAHF